MFVRWLFRALIWFLIESWEVLVGAILAAAGFDVTYGIELIFGENWHQIAPDIIAKFGPVFFFLTAVLLFIRLIRRRLFTHQALNERLRGSIVDLDSDNVQLRIHAIDEIIEITRISRRLHPRGVTAIAHHLRQRFPAPLEDGREVTMSQQRFGPPRTSQTQEFKGGTHSFVNRQYRIEKQQLSVDAQAALDAISRRRQFFDDPRRWIDLSFTQLPSANLEKSSMKRVLFVGANLRHAQFQNASLSNCCFGGAILNDAFMTNADLRRASFAGVMAHRLHLDGADLRKASFWGADLNDASLQKSNAREANFGGANMWRVSGGLADFSQADFFGARLQGADFHASINLTREQIEGPPAAQVDKNTRLPWSGE